MSDEVSLAQQQVSPHGLQMLQQQVVAVENIQQVFAGVKVGSVYLLLKRPLQVGQQLCSYERGQENEGRYQVVARMGDTVLDSSLPRFFCE